MFLRYNKYFFNRIRNIKDKVPKMFRDPKFSKYGVIKKKYKKHEHNLDRDDIENKHLYYDVKNEQKIKKEKIIYNKYETSKLLDNKDYSFILDNLRDRNKNKISKYLILTRLKDLKTLYSHKEEEWSNTAHNILLEFINNQFYTLNFNKFNHLLIVCNSYREVLNDEIIIKFLKQFLQMVIQAEYRETNIALKNEFFENDFVKGLSIILNLSNDFKNEEILKLRKSLIENITRIYLNDDILDKFKVKKHELEFLLTISNYSYDINSYEIIKKRLNILSKDLELFNQNKISCFIKLNSKLNIIDDQNNFLSLVESKIDETWVKDKIIILNSLSKKNIKSDILINSTLNYIDTIENNNLNYNELKGIAMLFSSYNKLGIDINDKIDKISLLFENNFKLYDNSLCFEILNGTYLNPNSKYSSIIENIDKYFNQKYGNNKNIIKELNVKEMIHIDKTYKRNKKYFDFKNSIFYEELLLEKNYRLKKLNN